MYADHDLVSRMPEGDKIRLLTDISCLTDGELRRAAGSDTPAFRCAFLWDPAGGFPSPAAMARSWNGELTAAVSAALCGDRAAAGVSRVLLPTPKAGLSPREQGLSEDPFLSGTMAAAYVRGARSAGMPAVLSGYGFTSAEGRGLDGVNSPVFRRVFLEDPYRLAMAEGCPALLTETGESVPPLVQTDPMDPTPTPMTVLHRSVGEEGTVTAIRRGEILLTGSASALQRALHNYRRLASAVEHGKATVAELEAAMSAGEAMSPAELDHAVHKLLSFAAASSESALATPLPSEELSALRKQATAASAVLLTNRRRCLPLRKGKRVALIGRLSREGEEAVLDRLTAALSAHGISSVGYAPGYDLTADRREELVEEAVTLADGADVVILFLHTRVSGIPVETSAGERLPPDQLILSDRLSRMGKRVIAVLFGDRAVDMSFARDPVHPFHGLLLLPAQTEVGAEVAMELILGDRGPEGRLAATVADPRFAGLDGDLRHGLPVGPFVGYRYYDAMGRGAAYPFGHGLTYASFLYLFPFVKDGSVTFTVVNVSRRRGVAVPQIYLGMEGSVRLRPKKELVGFTRLELGPYERRTVTVPLPALRKLLSEGSPDERGRYILSIGESVADIRLRVSLRGGAVEVPPDGKDPADYLPTLTNVKTKHYTLEAEHTPMKHLLRNPVCGVIALALGVSLKIYDIVTATNALFLDIAAGALVLFALLFFIAEIKDRKQLFAREREELEEATGTLFAEAEEIHVPRAASFFAEGATSAEDSEEENEADSLSDRDFYADVDKELTVARAAGELVALGAGKGIALDEGTARSILSAMGTSRLVLVRDMKEEVFVALLSLLGDYFDCSAAMDTVGESYVNETAALLAPSETGEPVPTRLLDAMTAADANPRAITVAGLDGVSPETMGRYVVPFARYARTPRSDCTVVVPDSEHGDVAYPISENLWLFLRLREGEPLSDLPDYVAEIATVNRWDLELTTPDAEGPAEFRPFPYGQMLYLCDKAITAFSPEEDVWKRLDRLEGYAARYGEFHMTNKLWLGLETYLALLTAAGGETIAATDEALSVKVMPSLIRALSGRLPREERSLSETLDALLGEDRTLLCHGILKESGADLV